MTPDHLNLLPGETVQDSIEMFKHFANFRIAILWYFGPNGGLAFQRLRPRNNSTGQRLGIAGAAPGQIIADGLQLVGRRLGPGDAHVVAPAVAGPPRREPSDRPGSPPDPLQSTG